MFRKSNNRSKLNSAAGSFVESLESRQLMSVSLSGSTLNVFGTPNADAISVSAGLYGRVTVTDNGLTNSYAGVNQVRVYGYGGNDTISAASTFTRQIIASGGTGNDWIRGGAANDSLIGEEGIDTIYGGAGQDSIRGGSAADWILGDSGNDSLWGDAGADNVHGGTGNDSIFGGAGADRLSGNDGDDTLVSIGGTTLDTLYGNAGFDSFWADAEPTEIVADADFFTETLRGNVHRVASFMTLRFNNGTPWSWSTVAISRELDGQNFRDPANGSNYASFSNRPLFGNAGPGKDDIDQGGLGDCYFMATLGAAARTNPNFIRQRVVDLGDGTYAVRFQKNSSVTYVRVDGDLPTAGGSLVYAGLGTGNAIWAPIMEKAWACFRNGYCDYKTTEGGWMDEAFSALGRSTDSLSVNAWYKLWHEGKDLWNYVNGQLSAGKAVTVATGDDSANLVSNHAYMVDRTYRDSGGTRHVVLRNPWGGSGAYVDLTGVQLINSINKVQSAFV